MASQNGKTVPVGYGRIAANSADEITLARDQGAKASQAHCDMRESLHQTGKPRPARQNDRVAHPIVDGVTAERLRTANEGPLATLSDYAYALVAVG